MCGHVAQVRAVSCLFSCGFMQRRTSGAFSPAVTLFLTWGVWHDSPTCIAQDTCNKSLPNPCHSGVAQWSPIMSVHASDTTVDDCTRAVGRPTALTCRRALSHIMTAVLPQCVLYLPVQGCISSPVATQWALCVGVKEQCARACH